jgi:LysR family transcriptional regulator, regulator for bpeEF and oprC
MDKLRAIQYFNQAAESASFAAAARHFDVSTPAVTQLIAALERALGVHLFHRTTQGITLTADGERYYETTRKAAADIYEVEQRLGSGGTKLRGTLTVGMRSSLGANCVMPKITRFLARHPEIELVFKPIVTVNEIDEKKLDVAVLVGWNATRSLDLREKRRSPHNRCAESFVQRRPYLA